MPKFSDLSSLSMYYSGSSPSSSSYSPYSSPYGGSYSSSYLSSGGNYSSHSSLGGYGRTPITPRWIPGGRNYSPLLSTISERGANSPVRVNSPRSAVRTGFSSHYSPANYVPRPININTADIDVSRERFRTRPTTTSSPSFYTHSSDLTKPTTNSELHKPTARSIPKEEPPITTNTPAQSDDTLKHVERHSATPTEDGPFMPRIDGKVGSGDDNSPGLHRSTIRRGRTVVRLHTLKRKERNSPRQSEDQDISSTENIISDLADQLPCSANTSPKGSKWREKLSEDLAYKDKREKKTPGEKLVEKFKLKDRGEEEGQVFRKNSPNSDYDTSKEALSILQDAISVQNTMPISKSPDRRCSMELLAEQANVLDTLIRQENLSTACLDLSKIGIIEQNPSQMNNEFTASTKRKSFKDSGNRLQTTQSEHSLHDRVKSLGSNKELKSFSRKSSLKKSSSGGSISRLDSIKEISKETLRMELPPIDENRISLKVDKVLSKPKQKTKITSTVEVSQSHSPLKARVGTVVVENKLREPKKEINYVSTVEEDSAINDINNMTSNLPNEVRINNLSIEDRLPIMKIRNLRNSVKTSINSDENEADDFWGKIGKRETVYLKNRKQQLQEQLLENRRAIYWYPEEEDSATIGDPIERGILTSIIEESRFPNHEQSIQNSQYEGEVSFGTQINMHSKMGISKQNSSDLSSAYSSIDVIDETSVLDHEAINATLRSEETVNDKLFEDLELCTKEDLPPSNKDDNLISKLNNIVSTEKITKIKPLLQEKVEVTMNKSIKAVLSAIIKPELTVAELTPVQLNKVAAEQDMTKNASKPSEGQLVEDSISESSAVPKIPEKVNKSESVLKVKTNKSDQYENSNSKTYIKEAIEKNAVSYNNNSDDKSDSTKDEAQTSEVIEEHSTNNDIPELEQILEVTNRMYDNITESRENDNVETSVIAKSASPSNTETSRKDAKNKSKEAIQLALANMRKPVKEEFAVRPLIATPRNLQKKVPQVIHSSSSSESSSNEDSDNDEADDSSDSEGSTEFYECENHGPDGRTSTGSNDSGFDSSAPASPAGFVCIRKDCDVNCHRKCEKLTANLCGVNQRLLVEALATRAASRRGGENAASTSGSQTNPAASDSLEAGLETSTAYGLFRRTGHVTPPAKSIPRFRKYNIEDFHFLKVLGKGSFGKVLLAELRDTEYYYAVKCLKKDVVLEDDDVECTLIERKVLALGTNHPYLCHLFATFQTDSHLFFVMEYLNGGDLMFHIQQSGRFPEPRAKFYAAEIVSGLKFLHKRGIVYRDLKLDNILLDYEGHVRIADFGMCKLQIYLEKTADTFCGTPDYMAPEIIKGLKYNQTVDWWSFGVLLYEMLIGQSPFSGCDEDELFWSICNELPSYPRFLSQQAHTILVRLLDKDARTRLGGTDCMHGDVRDQDFFHSIHWDRLDRRELEAPFRPRVRHPLDTQYFDRAFTGERPRLTACEPNVLRTMDQQPFRGFSYTNPNATDR